MSIIWRWHSHYTDYCPDNVWQTFVKKLCPIHCAQRTIIKSDPLCRLTNTPKVSDKPPCPSLCYCVRHAVTSNPLCQTNQVWAFVHCVDTPLVLYHCDKQYLTVCPTNNYFLTLRHCVDKPNVSDNHWSELLFNCVDTLLLLYVCVQQTCVFLTQKSDNHFVCALNHSTSRSCTTHCVGYNKLLCLDLYLD